MREASGTVPRGWRLTNLGEALSDIQAGVSPQALDHPARPGELGVLKVSAVTWNEFRDYENKALPVGFDGAGCPRVGRGDLLLSRANTLQLIAAPVIANDDYPNLLLSDKILRLVPRGDVAHAPFLLYALRTRSARRYFESHATGTSSSMRNVSQATIRALPISLPPLAEQRRLAAILDQADALRAKRRAALERLKYLAPNLFLDMFGNPRLNEKCWPIRTFAEVGRVQLGRQRAPKYQTGKHTRPYVRVANVFEDRIDLTDLLSMDFDDRDFAAYRLEHGDILLNEGQSTELVGRPAMWRLEVENCCFQNTLVRFQPDRENLTSEFSLALCLWYYRAGGFSKISSKTSNVAHLGASRFARLPVPVPPMTLQKLFSTRYAEIRALEGQASASLARLDALFASLQHRAFRGEL